MNVRNLKNIPLLKRVAVYVGVAPSARSSKAAVESKGGKLTFGWSSTALRVGDDVVLFPPASTFLPLDYVGCMDYFRTRAVFKSANGLNVADCRGPAEYKLPSGGRAWMPSAAESIDIFAGYFAQGGPQLGQIAFDFGAYCGETTIEMAMKVGPTGRVFAFEPDSRNLFWLRKNIAQSGLNNINVVPKGVWKETTTLEFSGNGTAQSSVLNDGESSSAADVIRIEVLSPADTFALAGRAPDFIKMDIEGAEVEVVKAMAPLLKESNVAFAIASYHVVNGRKASDLITPVLEECGFAVTTGFPAHQTTWARSLTR